MRPSTLMKNKDAAIAAANTVKQPVQDKAIDFIKGGNTEGLAKMLEEGNKESKFLNRLHSKSGKSALIVAAEEGRIECAEMLLDSQANVNLADPKGMTALLFAAQNGEIEILDMLIGASADIHAKTLSIHDDALSLACIHNQIQCAEKLLTLGLSCNQFNSKLETPLSNCVKFQYFQLATLLLNHGGDINVVGQHGNTPIIRNAFDGRLDTAKYILENKGEVNARNENGESALMIACKHNHESLVKCLLEYGADVNMADNLGKTAAMYTCIANKPNILRMLADAGADLNLQDRWGFTALMFVVANNKYATAADTLDILTSHGAVVNLVDRSYNSALIQACRNNNIDFAAYLVKNGANLRFTNIDNQSALDFIFDVANKQLLEELSAARIQERGEEEIALEIDKPAWIKALHKAKKLEEALPLI